MEFVYGMHGQYDSSGNICLNGQIFENYKEVEKKEKARQKETEAESVMTQDFSRPQDLDAVSETTDRRKGFFFSDRI